MPVLEADARESSSVDDDAFARFACSVQGLEGLGSARSPVTSVTCRLLPVGFNLLLPIARAAG